MIGVFVKEAIRDYITIVKKISGVNYLKLIIGWEVFRIFKVHYRVAESRKFTKDLNVQFSHFAEMNERGRNI